MFVYNCHLPLLIFYGKDARKIAAILMSFSPWTYMTLNASKKIESSRSKLAICFWEGITFFKLKLKTQSFLEKLLWQHINNKVYEFDNVRINDSH